MIALVGIIIRKPADGSGINWARVTIYIAFLTCLAATLTPGIEPEIRTTTRTLVSFGFGFLIVDAARRRT